ncbi:GDSL-type esterase/lipase family protein [Granulicella sibirica]|uniref:Putative periplasmic protein n=1 Tax=Granulicella sibirica TaxID=2479048 RepID=A0A4Q0T837_9BACT|nr:GDSL-type esterase/lipase family protein [Granulicella sibirica]RXH57771.1 putative periplasmic protein [Granulicella sibirica]
MAHEQIFPIKTALALVTCVAALAVYRHFDHGKGLSPAIFGEAAHVTLIRHDPSLTPAKASTAIPLNGVQKAQAGPVAAPHVDSPCPEAAGGKPRAPISPYLIDDCGDLDPFFAALHGLELPAVAGAADVVTVLHYGDSPTTADLITGDVRSMLQERFGDAGYGFLLTAKPWAWYQHRGIEITDTGWKTSTAVGKGREEVYGIGGASFEGDTDASSKVSLKGGGQATMEVAYLERQDGGTVQVSADDASVDSFSTAHDGARPAWRAVRLPAGAKAVEIKPASRSVRLFGETFRTGRRGILYDSLGLNGASTTVLSNGFNAGAWAAELQHEGPRLVIINYGTNESGFDAFVDKQYEPVLRAAITRVRAALPGVPILVMSPMDRGKRTGVDQIETFDTIPKIIAIQKKVAAEQKCAFFDTFDAMGGDGTMSRWYTGHPRLVAGDLIHPTPQGAALVAQLFVKDLLLGYDRYMHRQTNTDLVVPPAPNQPGKMGIPKGVAPAAPGLTSSPAPVAKPKPSAAGEPVATPKQAEPATPQPASTDTPHA